MKLRSLIAWTLVLPTLALSCAPAQSPVRAASPSAGSTGQAFEGVQCSVVRPSIEPDLMAWDPASRLNLRRLKTKGVVAVRYRSEGCNVKLELLPHCIGKGTYEYTPYSANEHKIARNSSELFAQLPIGAASLTGKVKGKNSLRTDYMLVGQHSLPPTASYKLSDLEGGGCAQATHVVSAVYVGGFAMVSGEEHAIEAATTVFGTGTGAASGGDGEKLADEGNAEACKAAQTDAHQNERCDVPLRIALMPLEGVAAVEAAAGSNAPEGSHAPSEGAAPAATTPLAPIVAPAPKALHQPGPVPALQRTLGYAAAGTGTLMLIGAGLLELHAANVRDGASCVTGSGGFLYCTSSGLSDFDRAKSLASTSQWIGIGGLAVGAAGAALIFTAPSATPPTVGFQPWVDAAGGAGLNFGGAL